MKNKVLFLQSFVCFTFLKYLCIVGIGGVINRPTRATNTLFPTLKCIGFEKVLDYELRRKIERSSMAEETP
jgi:hypothetical protein